MSSATTSSRTSGTTSVRATGATGDSGATSDSGVTGAAGFSRSALLDARIELLLPAFRRVGGRVWSVPEPDQIYPEYLCLMHQVIRSTVPLMEAALARCQELAGPRGDGDPVAAALVPYWKKHIPEEWGHDEWLRQDLAAIGCDPDEVWRRIPPASAATLVGAQYYWIHHHHPACLLGHIAVVEGNPPDRKVAGELARRTGYPESGFRTLHRHAALDVKHRADLRELIDRLPLDDRLDASLGLSALHTVQSLIDMFEQLAMAFERGRRSSVPPLPGVDGAGD
ncbi:MAG: iron-containing redox enzyme family protein [Actinomycetia bacterium]|nr:iron-containing redox enzyme family protein [Actinomycetes bacterium]